MNQESAKLDALKQQLGYLYALGSPQKEVINELLNQDGSDVRADLRTAFNDLVDVDLDRLHKLRVMLDSGDVIRRSYHRCTPDGREQGCIFNVLLGVRNNAEALAVDYPSAEVLAAVARVTRAWDYETLPASTIREVLAAVIREREQLNATEDAAVRSASLAG